MTRGRLPGEGFIVSFNLGEAGSVQRPRGGDSYPPYDIERLRAESGAARLRITLAVAGFSEEELDVSVEARQLIVRGRQNDREEPSYLFRGIAARQFQRIFALDDGLEVTRASLRNGLLSIDLIRPEATQVVRKINISASL
ncbi:heat shock protein Hsp20 [Rhizobium sp. PDO1-076]|nr:heat shock protein Hsp20 [Rhizobium sp. PDO1-076]